MGQGALWAAMQELSKEDLAKAESAGFPIVLLILLAVFGSLAAAALPLALGFVAVTVTGALIFLLSQVMEMSVFVTNMASMIGIGVAVDYSLFIVARYREELAAGRPHGEARAVAMATSGLAVLFSGVTVIVSLAGLWMVDNTAIRSMALGAMLVVAVAMLASATLLPVLLGRRVASRWRFLRRRRPPQAGPGFWRRWTDAVMRRPVLAVAGSSAVLLTLALPVLGMQTGTGALEQFPRGHEVVRGFEAAAAATGAGAASPVQVIATAPDRAERRRRGRARRARRWPPTRGSARSPNPSPRATAARCCSWPRGAPTPNPTPPRPPSRACAPRCPPRRAWTPRSTSAVWPRRSATSTAWSPARCGRSSCSCSGSRISSCSCCCAPSCSRPRPCWSTCSASAPPSACSTWSSTAWRR